MEAAMQKVNPTLWLSGFSSPEIGFFFLALDSKKSSQVSALGSKSMLMNISTDIFNR